MNSKGFSSFVNNAIKIYYLNINTKLNLNKIYEFVKR